MKVICSALALCAAFQSAAAFAPAASHAASSALKSSTMPLDERASWDLPSIATPIRCEGLNSRKTFSFHDINQDTVQLAMTTMGRPLTADIQLWIGPDWTPMKMKAFSDDGLEFPCQLLVGTRSKVSEVEVRNIGPMEHPFQVSCAYARPPLSDIRAKIPESISGPPEIVQGANAIRTFPLDASTKQVRVYIQTDTRQLNAIIELLNGPNNIKQQFEIFTNNGVQNSFYTVFNCDKPGGGYTVRIKNKAPVEFPCYAYVAPVESAPAGPGGADYFLNTGLN